MFYPLNLYDAASKESKVSSDLRIARAKKTRIWGSADAQVGSPIDRVWLWLM